MARLDGGTAGGGDRCLALRRDARRARGRRPARRTDARCGCSTSRAFWAREVLPGRDGTRRAAGARRSSTRPARSSSRAGSPISSRWPGPTPSGSRCRASPSAAASPATAASSCPELTASATRAWRRRRSAACSEGDPEAGVLLHLPHLRDRAVARGGPALSSSAPAPRARGRRACLSASSTPSPSLPLVPTYLVLMALSALENVFPPVPADTAVALGAFLARRGEVSVVPLAVLCWLANLASAAAMYAFARRHGRGFFREGWGRKLMPPEVLAALEEAYERWGTAGIFLSRFLPGVRAAVPPFAGVAGLRAGEGPRARRAGLRDLVRASWPSLGLPGRGELGGGEVPRRRHQPRARDRGAGRWPGSPSRWLWRRSRRGASRGRGHAPAWRSPPRRGGSGLRLERSHRRADPLLRSRREPAVEEARHALGLVRHHLGEHSLPQPGLRRGEGERVFVRVLLETGEARRLEALGLGAPRRRGPPPPPPRP